MSHRVQLSPVRTIHLELVRPIQSASARATGQPYGTGVLVFIIVVMMLAATLVGATAGAAQVSTLVDNLALQSSSWAWSDPADFSRLFSYVLLHGSPGHFFWNTVLLLLAGSVVEWRLGLKVIIGIFLAGAAFAALSHILMFPDETRTLIGASGGISALFGAALIVAGDLGLRVRLPGTDRWIDVTLRRMLLIWLTLQCVALSQLILPGHGEVGVAYWSHISGFAFGVAGALACRRLGAREREADLDAATMPAFGSAGD